MADLDKLASELAEEIAGNLAYLEDIECQNHAEAVEDIKERIVRVFSLNGSPA